MDINLLLVAFSPLLILILVIYLSGELRYRTVRKKGDKYIIVYRKGFGPTIEWSYTDTKYYDFINKNSNTPMERWYPWCLSDGYALEFDTKEEAKEYSKTLNGLPRPS